MSITSPKDNTLMSSDIIGIVEDFEGEHSDVLEVLARHPDDEKLCKAVLALAEVDEDDWRDYKEAKRIDGECSGGDWKYGVQLIRESYFTEFAKERVEDTGAVPRDTLKYIVIDWEATADNLKDDYSEVEIEGNTYFYTT